MSLDNATSKFCRNCNRPVPPEQWAKFCCKSCAAKAGKSKTRWRFDAAGNVISKGAKAPKTTRASVAAPALKTTKE